MGDMEQRVSGEEAMKWVKITSWHAVEFWSRAGKPKTYCGRWVLTDAEVVDDLSGEKSCESCLRILANRQWTGEPDVTWSDEKPQG